MKPPDPLDEIRAELLALREEVEALRGEVEQLRAAKTTRRKAT